MKTQKIALGGGCHWCTEAVFQSLVGVKRVEQGYVASTGKNSSFSEGVIVHFNSEEIALKTLIEIHLHTHKSTSAHAMREKYRSAVYSYNAAQEKKAITAIKLLQSNFDTILVTEVLPFSAFKASRESLHNYYQKDPEKPFCKRFIDPKLQLLMTQFLKNVK